jgi:hypothetical protein
MIRLFVRIALIACCAIELFGCASFFDSKAKAPKPTIVSFPKGNASDGTKREPRLIGRIAMVNAEGKFVLISCDAWSAPAEGTALKCLRNGVESGIVNVGQERRGAYVTADIVTGAPERGDQVYQ